MRPWLKAGLIGGGILGLLTVLGGLGTVLPSGTRNIIGCCICIPFLLAYPGIGALAAYWLTPPRTAGDGAKEGALAGMIAGAINGVVSVLLTLILSATGAYERVLYQLPPDAMRALEETGLKGLYTTSGMLGSSCLGGICGILWAVAMGAAGGAIFAAIQRE
ncbi:MAG: hypothetical protein D6793_01195 [Thermoflexia bacterium]|nr:MAG: hypothetical protein D6793_01195 [Thermoflexia bacterium]